MKNIDTDLSRFNAFHGLSCVENYLLYVLSVNNYEYKHLYAQSYISFSGIVNYFFNEKKLYEYFDSIPRLQTTAGEYDIISIKTTEKPFSDIDPEHGYYLLRLCPEYTEETYGESTWRSDHYVLLAGCNNSTWSYINDTPRDYRILSSSEMLNAYTGTYIYIDIAADITDKVKTLLLRDFINSIPDNICSAFSTDDIIAARNALAVLRILRHRLFEYCSQYICCDFMVDYLNELDRQFSMIEYMRLRNRVDYNKIYNMFVLLYQKDSEITEKINARMCEMYG